MASHLQRPPRGLDNPSQVRETFLKVGGRDTYLQQPSTSCWVRGCPHPGMDRALPWAAELLAHEPSSCDPVNTGLRGERGCLIMTSQTLPTGCWCGLDSVDWAQEMDTFLDKFWKWISSWGQREGEAFWGNMGVPSSTAWGLTPPSLLSTAGELFTLLCLAFSIFKMEQ